jgi:hypothetical protein
VMVITVFSQARGVRPQLGRPCGNRPGP